MQRFLKIRKELSNSRFAIVLLLALIVANAIAYGAVSQGQFPPLNPMLSLVVFFFVPMLVLGLLLRMEQYLRMTRGLMLIVLVASLAVAERISMSILTPVPPLPPDVLPNEWIRSHSFYLAELAAVHGSILLLVFLLLASHFRSSVLRLIALTPLLYILVVPAVGMAGFFREESVYFPTYFFAPLIILSLAFVVHKRYPRGFSLLTSSALFVASSIFMFL